jgi:hypothetical protein
MYALSLTSGESQSFVAVSSTRCTTPWDVSGLFKNSLTTAVRVCNCTCAPRNISIRVEGRVRRRTGYDSSMKESTKIPRSSSALSILFAYSPMIHMSDALASGSSSSSRLAQSVGMTPSYVAGYFRNMSYQRFFFNHRRQRGEGWVYLHDDDGLLHDVADSRGDQLQQHVHTPFRRRINIHGGLSDRLYTLPHKIHIHL